MASGNTLMYYTLRGGKGEGEDTQWQNLSKFRGQTWRKITFNKFKRSAEVTPSVRVSSISLQTTKETISPYDPQPDSPHSAVVTNEILVTAH